MTGISHVLGWGHSGRACAHDDDSHVRLSRNRLHSLSTLQCISIIVTRDDLRPSDGQRTQNFGTVALWGRRAVKITHGTHEPGADQCRGRVTIRPASTRLHSRPARRPGSSATDPGVVRVASPATRSALGPLPRTVFPDL